ncbi:MAG: hypothetical protein R3E77_04465 [Steroidobacteraceae bacterium]
MAMWRPPERIRHTPVPGRWPTADEAADSLLFTPLRAGALQLSERSWVPAMVPWRASEDGDVTPNVIEWYRRFAQGEPGVIVVEATGIRDIPSGPLLRIGADRYIDGLRRLTEVVRDASGGRTRLLIQLIDFLTIRRRPDPQKFLRQYLRVTSRHAAALGIEGATDAEIRERLLGASDDELRGVLAPREYEALAMGYRERITDCEIAAIANLPRQLPGLFAAAAERAQLAGFDGVELHYAHAYTMASFLSATNTRSDGYGNDMHGRLRMPLEVYAAVRERVGSDFAVGCRMLADECIAGGTEVDEARQIAVALARAGMDFISLSRGGKFDDAKQPKVGEAAYPYTGRSGYECMPSYYSDARGPFGRNFAAAQQIRQSLRDAGLATPLVVAGGVFGFEQAEAVLRQGIGDIVGLARQALADPDWFRKVRSGRGGDVRVCLYTNYCEALDQRHREVTCELWDRDKLDEPGVAISADGKRRLIAPDWSP